MCILPFLLRLVSSRPTCLSSSRSDCTCSSPSQHTPLTLSGMSFPRTAVAVPTYLQERAFLMKKINYTCFSFQERVVISKPMQDCVPSCHYFHYLYSKKCPSISIVQIPTRCYPQRLTVSTVRSHCFQLCTGHSQPYQSLQITKILVIEKDGTSITVVNAARLLEEVIGVIELFQSSIQRPAVRQHFRMQS